MTRIDTVSETEVPEPEIVVTPAMGLAGADAVERAIEQDWSNESIAEAAFIAMERVRRAEEFCRSQSAELASDGSLVAEAYAATPLEEERASEAAIRGSEMLAQLPTPTLLRSLGYRNASEDEPERDGDAGRR